MIPRILLMLALALAALAAPAAAGKKPNASKTTAAAAGEAPKPTAAASAASPDERSGPRTLDAIQIKGEVAVPQVLFITARDQRRVLDFSHKRYLRTAREVGERTTLPERIIVIERRPVRNGKEITP